MAQTVSAAMLSDNMCYTWTEKWFISKLSHRSVRNRQATHWENGGDLIRDFKRRETKYLKRKKNKWWQILNLTNNQGNAFKITMVDHCISAKMDKINSKYIKYLEGYRAVGTHIHCWEYKWIQPLWKLSLSCKVERKHSTHASDSHS